MELSLTFSVESRLVSLLLNVSVETLKQSGASLLSFTRDELLIRKQDPLPQKIVVTLKKGDVKTTQREYLRVGSSSRFSYCGVVLFEIR